MEVHDERVPLEEFATGLRHFPQVCVDLVVRLDGGVLLTQRTNEPARGAWFWPGGRLRKGERLDDGVERVLAEELGLSVHRATRLGVSEHFWDVSSIPGVESRHTIPVVYEVHPIESVDAVELDDQHGDFRILRQPGSDLHRYVEEYVERFGLFNSE